VCAVCPYGAVNIGLYCNQACSHCHVESSPLRKAEVMQKAVADRLVQLLDTSDGGIKTLDITGGAPELMVRRCNLRPV